MLKKNQAKSSSWNHIASKFTKFKKQIDYDSQGSYTTLTYDISGKGKKVSLKTITLADYHD